MTAPPLTDEQNATLLGRPATGMWRPRGVTLVDARIWALLIAALRRTMPALD